MHRAILAVVTSSVVGSLALGTFALGGCARSRRYEDGAPGSARSSGSGVFSRLDTNDWLVSQRASVWKVIEEVSSGAPRHIGYVFGREYRQEAGGPAYKIYTVTTRDRRNEIGHVDQMGRAVRYEPVRGGGFDRKDVGRGTLQDSVAAIFDTTSRLILEETSERRLAFEALDLDANGRIEKQEYTTAGPRVSAADRNRDGYVDLSEFEAIDVL